MSACRCLTQRPLPHEGHCCLKDGWNPAADQLPDKHRDLVVCSHADEWVAVVVLVARIEAEGAGS
jgi:hypothetical protein